MNASLDEPQHSEHVSNSTSSASVLEQAASCRLAAAGGPSREALRAGTSANRTGCLFRRSTTPSEASMVGSSRSSSTRTLADTTSTTSTSKPEPTGGTFAST